MRCPLSFRKRGAEMNSVLLALSLLSPSVGCAVELQAEQDPKRLARYLLSGVRSERERLQRGVVHAHGRKVIDSSAGKPRTESNRLEGEVIVFCAFDASKGLLRFDRTEPEPVAGGAGSSRSWHPQIFGGKYVRTPDQQMRWHVGNDRVEVHGIKEPNIGNMVRPFDVRVLGLVALPTLREGREFPSVMELYDSYATADTEVVLEKAELYKLRWVLDKKTDVQAVLWLDEKRGFSPVRYEFRDRQGAESRILWLSEVSWSRLAGVWVPKSARLESRSTPPSITTYEFAFDWKSVNEPLDERLFTIEGMDLKHGTYIFDYRLGADRPVVTAIGRKSVPEYDLISARSLGLPDPGGMDEMQSIPERPFPWLLVLCVIGLLLAGMVLYWYRRRRLAT